MGGHGPIDCERPSSLASDHCSLRQCGRHLVASTAQCALSQPCSSVAGPLMPPLLACALGVAQIHVFWLAATLQPLCSHSVCLLSVYLIQVVYIDGWATMLTQLTSSLLPPAAGYSRPVWPGYGRCAPPPQPPSHCACLPAALSGYVGCRCRPLVCAKGPFRRGGF